MARKTQCKLSSFPYLLPFHPLHSSHSHLLAAPQPSRLSPRQGLGTCCSLCLGHSTVDTPGSLPHPFNLYSNFPTSEPSSHPLVRTYTSLHPPSPRSLFSFLFNIRHHLKFYVFINLPYWEFVVPPLYTTRFLNKQSRL